MVNGALASNQLVLSGRCLCCVQWQRFGVSFFLIQLQRSVKHRLPATVTASNDDGCLAETERLMAWYWQRQADEHCQQCLSGRVQLNVKPRCMDLPRGLMCFHLRYMLFIALESLKLQERLRKIMKDVELAWKLQGLFLFARFSVVMLPLAARFRVQKCGHDILQGPSSFVV